MACTRELKNECVDEVEVLLGEERNGFEGAKDSNFILGLGPWLRHWKSLVIFPATFSDAVQLIQEKT